MKLVCVFHLCSRRILNYELSFEYVGPEEQEEMSTKPLELTFALPSIDEIETMVLNLSFDDVERVYLEMFVCRRL